MRQHRRKQTVPQPKETRSANPQLDLHKDSHLSRTPAEAALTDFEFVLHHIVEAFRRWTVELHAFVGGEAMANEDVSVLQVVRMRERAKSISEIAKFLNREDTANVQYSLRKLESAGLIRKVPGLAPRQTAYVPTARGIDVTDKYAELRREILLGLMQAMGDSSAIMGEATRKMALMTGFYDQAARLASIYRSDTGAVARTAPPSSGESSDRYADRSAEAAVSLSVRRVR